MQQLSGSEIIIQFLKDEGVEFIFGYPGGAVLHIYDALYAQNEIQHILVRHEQGATTWRTATHGPPANPAWCW
jgi:acetolactate synthase-1/2/3 large subunit